MSNLDKNINSIVDNENSDVVMKKTSKKSWQITTIILGILVVILTIGHVLVYVSTQWINNEMENLNNRILSLQEENEEIRDKRNKVASKCKFYFDYVAIIPKNSNTYHLYGCKDLDLSNGGKICHQEQANSEGYKACKYCASIFINEISPFSKQWEREQEFIYQ